MQAVSEPDSYHGNVRRIHLWTGLRNSICQNTAEESSHQIDERMVCFTFRCHFVWPECGWVLLFTLTIAVQLTLSSRPNQPRTSRRTTSAVGSGPHVYSGLSVQYFILFSMYGIPFCGPLAYAALTTNRRLHHKKVNTKTSHTLIGLNSGAFAAIRWDNQEFPKGSHNVEHTNFSLK